MTLFKAECSVAFSLHSSCLHTVLDSDQTPALPVANRLFPWCLWLACLVRSGCAQACVFICVGMRRSKQCQTEMVMCCNTVPAPCANVSNQHARVKFPCPLVRHWKTLRIQPNPLLRLVLSLSLSCCFMVQLCVTAQSHFRNVFNRSPVCHRSAGTHTLMTKCSPLAFTQTEIN